MLIQPINLYIITKGNINCTIQEWKTEKYNTYKPGGEKRHLRKHYGLPDDDVSVQRLSISK
jgi:hypothetical protein